MKLKFWKKITKPVMHMDGRCSCHNWIATVYCPNFGGSDIADCFPRWDKD